MKLKTLTPIIRKHCKRLKLLEGKKSSKAIYIASNIDLSELSNVIQEVSIVKDQDRLGQKQLSIVFEDGTDVTIFGVSDKSFGAALLTSSSEFFVLGLKNYARKLGYLLTSSGLFKDNIWVAGETESSIFNKLDLNFIPPEARDSVKSLIDFYKLKNEYKMTKSESLMVLSEISSYLQDIRLGL